MTNLAPSILLLAAALFGAGPAAAQPEGEADSTQIHFSGYDWQIKTSDGRVGPGPNLFGAEGVRVDRGGNLRLGIGLYRGRWQASEVVLNRSLGYGTYTFVVRETAGIDPNAVLGLFLWDPVAFRIHNRELDIEISRWGDPKNSNSQFVVQPYSRPGNQERFGLPGGRAVLTFTWAPNEFLCRAFAGGKLIHQHLFTEGVSEPGAENVRINLWLFRGFPPSTGKPIDIVIERFEFTPINR